MGGSQCGAPREQHQVENPRDLQENHVAHSTREHEALKQGGWLYHCFDLLSAGSGLSALVSQDASIFKTRFHRFQWRRKFWHANSVQSRTVRAFSGFPINATNRRRIRHQRMRQERQPRVQGQQRPVADPSPHERRTQCRDRNLQESEDRCPPLIGHLAG